METRPLGETGHESSIVTLGSYALQHLEQPAANRLVELAVSRGVNHVDVAPTYGDAEEKLAPGLEKHREELFLGCKTLERDRDGAADELRESLARLGVDRFDLYQFHAVTEEEDVDAIVEPGGALEAVEAAREEGLLDHVGVTSHGPADAILDAMDRIEPDTVMLPMNYVVAGSDGEGYDAVIERARERDIGTIGIKAFAKGPWPPESELPREDRPYGVWYEPFDTQAEIDDCLRFAVSQGLTTIANAGDPTLFPMVLDAAERYRELDGEEQDALVERGRELDSPVPRR